LKVHLIAVHYQGRKIIGFRLLDYNTREFMDVPYDNAAQVLRAGKAHIDGLELSGGKLKGTNGVLSRYPKLIGGKLSGNNNIIILKQLEDVGYTVSDWQGTIKSYRNADIIKLSETMQISNGKVVTREDGTKFISAINGSYEQQDLPKSVKKTPVKQTVNNVEPTKVPEKQANENKTISKSKQTMTAKEKLARLSGKAHQEKEVDDGYSGVKLRETVLAAPKVSGNPTAGKLSRLKDIDSKHGMTIEQKLAKGMLTIRGIRSFYYAILSTVKRVETKEVPTMAVSVDTLYYNPDFVEELDLAELVFVEIHEICHIAMRHRQRQGSRIHKIWNIACDYYINKLICDEFGIKPGDDPIYPPEDKAGCGIQFLMGGLYDDSIDVSKDTPEKIYEELLEAAKQQAQQNQQNQQGQQEQQGEGSGDQGQGSGGYMEDGEEQGSGNETNEGSGDETGDKKGKGKGKDGDASDESGESDESGGSTNRMKEIADAVEDSDFRGKKVGKIKIVDIIDDAKSAEMDETQKQNTVRTLLERAVVLQKQNTGSFGGEQGSWMERYVEDVLAPKINWRSLVKNKLTLATQKITTYSRPDKRFLSRGRILPGPRELENDQLDNVKVCIDTSGSISDKDLGIALAQIKQLLRVYKAKAELMYWDTQVRVCEPFNNVQELLKIMPGGGGGTDVNCVFEQFEGRDYKIGRKQKPSIIIIFTDGYFGPVEDKYRKYKDTIWVIHDNPHFEPPFGVAAPFKYDEK